MMTFIGLVAYRIDGNQDRVQFNIMADLFYREWANYFIRDNKETIDTMAIICE